VQAECKSVLDHLMVYRQARKIRDKLIRFHFRVSDTGRWMCQGHLGQVSELRNTKIPKVGDSSRCRELKCQNTSQQESRNREMRNTEISKVGDILGYQELGMSRTLTTGVPELRNTKQRNLEIGTPTKNVPDWKITPFRGPRYRELKC
jgi:hypothetical protein